MLNKTYVVLPGPGDLFFCRYAISMIPDRVSDYSMSDLCTYDADRVFFVMAIDPCHDGTFNGFAYVIACDGFIGWIPNWNHIIGKNFI